LVVCLSVITAARAADRPKVSTSANVLCELVLKADKAHADPFRGVQLDLVVTAPDGSESRVPGFWAGGDQWKVRYASPLTGEHRYRSECSDTSDQGLHGVTGKIEVTPYAGDNPLYRHGPLKVSADRRHFEHRDGTPFLWLADTWWMGLCERIGWPAEFQALTADRRDKGFNVVQIVAGLYPDMPAFDQRGRNETGFPWEEDYARIRPEYFDAADQRIMHLVDQGLTPCVVGAWGYHLPWLGVERMKEHWRYLVARWGALPVVWCIAGEGSMPYYLAKDKEHDKKLQSEGWTEVAAYVRKTDPFHRLVTIHPVQSSRQTVTDTSVIDFDMLQTGHGDRASIGPTAKLVRASRATWPPMPTVNGEVCYEGILGSCFDDVQRFMVWSCLLSGTAGHTYGANGIWQLNRPDKPYGLSPHGGTWGATPWQEAMNLPGSRQTGLAKKLLSEYPWTKFDPHPEWASAVAPKDDQPWPWKSWIWHAEGQPATDAPAVVRYFRRTFDLPADKPIARAELRAAVDDRLTAHVNGHSLGTHGGWVSSKRFANVAHWLKSGRNVLAIRAQNATANVPQNPAGLICRLDVEFKDGEHLVIDSDDSWRSSADEASDWTAAEFDDGKWTKAIIAAPHGGGPWGQVGPPGDAWTAPFAAGIPGQVRIVYVPTGTQLVLHDLEPGVRYEAAYFDPRSGERKPLGPLATDPLGNATVLPPATDSDWVLVAEGRRDKPLPKPIALHPANGKYFLFRNRPLALITASEHYGSVVNRAFDFDRYLVDAADKKQTLTRTFLLFREQQSSRNPSSPVKPESPDYLAPYPRSGPGKALDGEPQYDLDQWNDEYFARLRAFLDRASALGIVVELTLFSNTYGDNVWALNPLRAANNIQKVGAVEWQDYNTLKDPVLNARQFAYVDKILDETYRYDNVYYEICNEPGAGMPGHATPADVDRWQAEVARAVREKLDRLGSKHLIFASQAFSYTPKFTQELDDTYSFSWVDAVNVHPLPNTVLGGRAFELGNFMSKELKLAEYAAFCRAAQDYPKPCVMDEDNAATLYRDPVGWTIHRKRAWIAALSQAHYDFIDFSITVGSEAGTKESSEQIRTWMKHLSTFLHGFPFVGAAPLADWVEKKPENVVSATLGVGGVQYVTYLADAREVTDPAAGTPIEGEISVRLSEGDYQVSVFSPTTGKREALSRVSGGTEPVSIKLPPLVHDMVLVVLRAR